MNLLFVFSGGFVGDANRGIDTERDVESLAGRDVFDVALKI